MIKYFLNVLGLVKKKDHLFEEEVIRIAEQDPRHSKNSIYKDTGMYQSDISRDCIIEDEIRDKLKKLTHSSGG